MLLIYEAIFTIVFIIVGFIVLYILEGKELI